MFPTTEQAKELIERVKKDFPDSYAVVKCELCQDLQDREGYSLYCNGFPYSVVSYQWSPTFHSFDELVAWYTTLDKTPPVASPS